MSATNDGQLKQWWAFEPCPKHGYVDLAPGILSDDGVTEIRTCPDCGSEIHTTAYFACRPAQATTFNLG